MIPFKIEQLPGTLKREVRRFLSEHPRSAAARLRPDVALLRGVWLAFVGPKLRERAAGIGSSPCEALKDFNRHFPEPPV
jgi:hypothetical protein